VENFYDQVVFARPGITKIEQLKGKRYGISGFGSATHYATVILLRHYKMDPKDLTLLPTGPDAERLAALVAGKIDATSFTSSSAAPARKAGLIELVQIADLGVEVQGNGFATSRDYVKTNRDVVKNALKGFVEAIYFIYANKKEAQQVFAKYMRTSDRDILEDSYKGYITMIPKKPYPTLKGIQFMLDMLSEQMPKAKNAKPEQFVDLSFLQELEKEGFFNEMAKRYPTKG
jgi:ABC-type nitrate/sulfonate/bicarbonate transport system substrate-binding protein